MKTYEWTVQCARRTSFGLALSPVASSTGSRGAESSGTELDNGPADVFGEEPSSLARIAHLLPAERRVADLYRDVAMCALGLNDTDGWAVVQKAIHGCATELDAATTKKRKRDSSIGGAPVEGGESVVLGDGKQGELRGEGPARDRTDSNLTVAGDSVWNEQGRTAAAGTVTNTTGMKHLAPNKIRLTGAKIFLDMHPGVVIVPVLDPAGMRSWNGEGYKAIVTVKGLGGADDPGVICSAIQMQEPGAVAEPEDVEMARGLLSHVVRGLAYSLAKRFEGGSALELPLDEWQQGELSKLKRVFATGAGVMVPVAKAVEPGRAPPPPLRDRIVEFGSASAARPSDDEDRKELHRPRIRCCWPPAPT